MGDEVVNHGTLGDNTLGGEESVRLDSMEVVEETMNLLDTHDTVNSVQCMNPDMRGWSHFHDR